MLKFIIPAVVLFLTVLFWEKINDIIYKKFGVKSNFVVIVTFVIIVLIILTLLYF
tara:strand:- start:977 stop:1141 length:165 start_codon:yes stop_codon:yes gene_type:complete